MKNLLARLSMKLAVFRPSRLNIFMMKYFNRIQLSTNQLKVIGASIQRKAPCKLLVFGAGNDSPFFSNLNRGGDTVFLEDDKDWFQKTIRKLKDSKVFLIHYDTQRSDWQRLLNDASLLNMVLPDDVEKKAWDIIFVDAPAGWEDQHPGRMKSIYLASRLIKKSGDVFVHDCNRKVEDIYCSKFLKKENLKTETKAPVGSLRYYKMSE